MVSPGGRSRHDNGFAKIEERVASVTLPPEPRRSHILPSSELMSGAAIKAGGVVDLFKTEPLLKGMCAAYLLKDIGCDYPGCRFCKRTIEMLPTVDMNDLCAAIYRCSGSSRAISRPGTPGRTRSDSMDAGGAARVEQCRRENLGPNIWFANLSAKRI